MPRKPINIEDKISELRTILEKYHGIPSQTVDRAAYANIKYYAKNYSDNPKVCALLEEFNVAIGERRKLMDFESSLDDLTNELTKEGRIPSISDNPQLYNSFRYFLKKYPERVETEELKYVFAHGSCYPLAESKEKRPGYEPYAIYIGCVPDYTKWKQNSAFEYILYVYARYKKLPAPKTKPMEELFYTINKWYRYQDNATPNFKFLIESLIALGCKETFLIQVHNSLNINYEELNNTINSLLITHGACAIHYLTEKIKEKNDISEKFLFYYFYNILNDSPKYRGLCGLGELFSSSDYSSCIYVHYRQLDLCDENTIKQRVLYQNRNWDENPPETIEEWEAYGEYRFFIPHKSSDWNLGEYRNFTKSFPRNCIEDGYPYFRYYRSGYRYLDYKLFLNERGIKFNKITGGNGLGFISTLRLADESDLEFKADILAAYETAKYDSDCYVDSYGAVYMETNEGLCLIYAPINAINYNVDSQTVKVCQNAFRLCVDTLEFIKFGPHIKELARVVNPKYGLDDCFMLKKIIIPEVCHKEYCKIFPKKCSNLFYNYLLDEIEPVPIIENNVLIWVPIVHEFTVPDNVIEISSRAFDVSQIAELTITGAINKISNNILYGCKSIKMYELKKAWCLFGGLLLHIVLT